MVKFIASGFNNGSPPKKAILNAFLSCNLFSATIKSSVLAISSLVKFPK
jgi:hypothetical protein